jgi:FHA domain
MPARLIWDGPPILLGNNDLIIRRGSPNQSTNDVLFLDDPTVDPHCHAVIHPDGQHYTITHRGNTSSTKVQGRSLELNRPHPLYRGDSIQIGNTDFLFRQSGTPQLGVAQTGGGLGVLIILAIIAVVAWVNFFTPQQSLMDFCSAVKSQDYQTAYNQLSKSAQSQRTEQQFASQLQQTLIKHHGLKSCTISGVQKNDNDNTATGKLTYTFGDKKTASYFESLITEDLVWKINRSSP